MSLENKIDFAIIFSVKNANPNGDPLNGNRPRITYDGLGEVSDVCLKRKIRNRLMAEGHPIFVQSSDNNLDGMGSLKERAESVLGKDTLNAKKTNPEDAARKACNEWLDVRGFGQVFAFKGSESSGVSISVRGPVSIHPAFSIEQINITDTQITKSVNGQGDGSKKSSDTMGTKHRVDNAIYVTYGAMSPQLAERTGFDNKDADAIKNILINLFEGDASSARPEGSMEIKKVIWWEHNCKSGQYSSAKVHNTLSVNPDGSYMLTDLDGLKPEEINGF
jgi:CRISPR-associated protein Csd2